MALKVMVLNPPSKFAKNVVRDLFWGCWCKGKRIASAKFPPTTLLCLDAAIEKMGGFQTILVDSQAEDISLDRVKEIVRKEKPDVVIIPSATMTFNEDCQTLGELKKELPMVTMSFGTHVTFETETAVKNEQLDYAILQEAEVTVVELLKAIEEGRDPSSVAGIAYRKDGKVKITAQRPWIQNLDVLPTPDRRKILKYEYYNPLVKRLPWTTAVTSRGCPGRCNYCTSPTFYGNTWRGRSAKSVVDEMEECVKLGYKEIFFRDETFTADRKRTVDICNMILERKLDISWICSARVNTVDKELMQLMKKAGCHMIRFGIESGNQQILNNIRKGVKAEMAEKVLNDANEIGMETHAHMMMGNIGETQETIEQTIQFLKRTNPTTITVGAFTPYPGTPVFDMVKAKAPEIGDGSASDLSRVHSIGFYSQHICDMSESDVGKAVRRTYKEFYLRPRYVLKRLSLIRSLDEFRRVVTAGLDVVSYATGSGADDDD